MATLEVFAGKGMRQHPVSSKYRPQFSFVGAKTTFSGSIELINSEKMLPGTSGVVMITFLKNIVSEIYLKEGATFTFREGARDLGKGQITEIV